MLHIRNMPRKYEATGSVLVTSLVLVVVLTLLIAKGLSGNAINENIAHKNYLNNNSHQVALAQTLNRMAQITDSGDFTPLTNALGNQNNRHQWPAIVVTPSNSDLGEAQVVAQSTIEFISDIKMPLNTSLDSDESQPNLSGKRFEVASEATIEVGSKSLVKSTVRQGFEIF